MHPPEIPDYTLSEFIGEGCTGSVWVASYQAQAPVAMKVFKGLAINRQLLSDSLVKVFKGSTHPGIVKIHDFDLASPRAYVTMDLCGEEVQLADGRTVLRPRTLESLCGALPSAAAWRIAEQIADAVASLHRKRIIHANLKPSNVLFADGENPRAMISDFCQGMLGGIEQIDAGESMFYAPPEQLNDADHFFQGRAELWDVYRFGATVFRLLTGDFPRLNEGIATLRQENSRELDIRQPIDPDKIAVALESEPDINWPSEPDSDLEKSRRHIVERCLRLDPEERYVDLREVLEAFRDVDSEHERREQLEGFRSTQDEFAVKAKRAKRRATLFGIGAAAAAAVAVFALVNRSGGSKNEDGAAKNPGNPVPGASETPDLIAERNARVAAESRLTGATDDLQQTQAALDTMFEMITARDAEGNPLYILPDGALGTVLNYYDEFAKRHTSRPEMADAVAHALNNSGELNLMLGDLSAARTNLSGAAELLSKLETGGGEAGDLLIRRAIVYSNLSDAYTASRMPTAAIESAKQATTIFTQLSERNPTSRRGSRLLAKSALSLARKMNDGNQPGVAGIYIEKSLAVLNGIEADKKINESDLAALAAASFESGRVERALGNREDAVKDQIEAIDRYLALLEARPEVEDYQFQLARAYGEAADLAALLGEPGEAKTANAEAADLLRNLADATPDNPAYRFLLAKRLRATSTAMRNSSGASKALAEQEKALILLEDLVGSHPKVPKYAYELAIVSGIQADLLGEAAKKDEAITRGRRSVDLMQSLLAEDLDPESNGAKRPKYRHALAALYGKLGHHTERAGDKPAAGHCFQKALKQYQVLAAGDPNDKTASGGVAWAEDRIKRLQ